MIGSVYDYYLSTYAGKPATRSDTHKKSELRSIYNNIVKISKKSPLYKVDVSDSIQRYAIDLKESARAIRSKTDDLLQEEDNRSPLRKPVSSDDSVVSISRFEGVTSESGDDELSLDINVKSLAKPQVNTGKFHKSTSQKLNVGDHMFDIGVGEYHYEFQFNVKNSDTMLSVQEKLARLVNRSDIGLTARILHDDEGRSALELTSAATGSTFTGTQFTVTNSSDAPYDEVVAILGLDRLSQEPADAVFTLNGETHNVSSNTFTINQNLELTLNRVSDDGDVTSIQYKDDIDSVLESIQGVVDSYNSILDLADSKKSNSDPLFSLSNEVRKIVSRYKNDLESIGLNIDQDGRLKFDKSLVIQAANEGDVQENLKHLKEFRGSLASKADEISIDPMKYVKKVMISYPNPVKNLANPYITSIYSGMMFNGYV